MISKDSNVKMSEEVGCVAEGCTLDGVLGELGSFGKYQLLLLLLLAFRDSFLNMCNFNYVFTAADVRFRCYVPECDEPGAVYNASHAWGSFALYNESEVCMRAAPLAASNWSCSSSSFLAGRGVPCERRVYEDYNSIVAEFDLGCEPWKRTLIGTVHNLGLVFSFIMCGFISDRYGRKVVIVVTPLVVGSVGLVKSFSLNYWMLLVLEFLEAAFGYGNASMVLSLECVSHHRRVVFSCMWDMLSSFGGAWFGLVAWQVPYWRHTMRAIYAPLLVAVCYVYLVDEGVRWLLAHDRRREAVRVLHKVAKVNNVTLSRRAQLALDRIAQEKDRADQAQGGAGAGAGADAGHLRAVLRSRTMLRRVALMAACFFCAMFVYNGTIINSTSISGNKFVNYSSLLLASIPTRALTALTLTRYGRRAPICAAYCLCAACFLASALVPTRVWWASVLLYIAGKMCSSYGIFSVSVVALEVFPTRSRHSLNNVATTVGRLGSVLAPQAPLLVRYMSSLPSVVFGVVSLGPALLALLLPDTSRSPLPDDLAAAEGLDRAHPEQPERAQT